MKKSVFYILDFLIIGVLCHHLVVSERRCRCLSNNLTCWPNISIWQTFNQSINGRLIAVRPSAAVCNSNPSNTDACATATVEWTNPFWRDDQAGAMQNHNWENSSCSVFFNSTTCNQGSVPILAVNATLPEHIQTTLQLVNTYNLRLVVKTSGHDYLGRSTAAGALLLWVHYMKNITFLNNFSLCTGENISNVVRLSAGTQWGEVYNWLAPYNLTAIGEASSTVGATGGYLQGGGHGPLTRWKGLAVDQILEFDVIMADGRHQTVNSCENMDLFWALRGGGGGTFAIVLSVVVRTYPSPSILGCLIQVNALNATRYSAFIHNFVRLLPTLADAGWTSYFYILSTSFSAALLLPNGDLHSANTTIRQIIDDYSDLNISEPILYPFPSFNDYSVTVLQTTNPTGGNVLLGSRLIPETVARNQPQQLADAFLQIIGPSKGLIIGHLVAGGQVSNTTQNSSVNPAWRTALLHMIYAQTWLDGTSTAEQQEIAKYVTKQVEILQTVSGGSQSGAYMNEADSNEINWQQKFFGTIENYNRLKSIKDQVDPNGIFVCNRCVGSDDWTENLNCPKTSNANKFHSITRLSFIIMNVFLWIFKLL